VPVAGGMLAAVRHGLGFSWSSAQLFRAGRNGEVTGEWSESLLRLVRIREHYHFIQLKSLGGDFDSSYMEQTCVTVSRVVRRIVIVCECA
jgi:hypothetical protein